MKVPVAVKESVKQELKGLSATYTQIEKQVDDGRKALAHMRRIESILIDFCKDNEIEIEEED